ncbi:hypothetical protein ACJMK2_007222 [Sinanodonta woodiana]|uniref:Uncharacterized protein n=1 Tax=Sinanodonta woodiana TaxID=1069815 RepID=A0ABD3VKU8_SINWO
MRRYLPGIIFFFGLFIDFFCADNDGVQMTGTYAYPKLSHDSHQLFLNKLLSQSEKQHDDKPVNYIHNILKNKGIFSTFEDKTHKTLKFKMHTDECNDTFCAYLGYMFLKSGYHAGQFIYSKQYGVLKFIIQADADMEKRDVRYERSSGASNSSRISGPQKFHSIDTEGNEEGKSNPTPPPAGQIGDRNHDMKSTIRMVLITGFGIIWILAVVLVVFIKRRCRRVNAGRANISDAVN